MQANVARSHWPVSLKNRFAYCTVAVKSVGGFGVLSSCTM